MTLRRLVFAALLAATATAAAADVSLLAPGANERLDGGRDAMLSWTAGSLPAYAEEWEAFLSVDGGAYYAVRITPHLDTRTRTFRWHVPNVAASQARLLLRVGNERDEQIIEFPQSFTIVPSDATLDLTSAWSDEAGEAATSGGAPSVEWISADLVRHRRRDSTATDVPSIGALHTFDAAAIASTDNALHAGANSKPLPVTQAAPPRADAAGAVRPILLLTTRLNV
jgi:hypothetical protein